MNSINLSTQDIKNVKKLLLPSSVEEKVMQYLSLQGKPSQKISILFKLLGFMLFLIVIMYCTFLLCKGICGEHYFDKWIAYTKQTPISNVLTFFFWFTHGLVFLVASYQIYSLANQKIEVISCKIIKQVTDTNYFSKLLGYIVRGCLITAFIVNGYWWTLLIYTIITIVIWISNIGTKEDLKKAIEKLDNDTKNISVETYYKMQNQSRKLS